MYDDYKRDAEMIKALGEAIRTANGANSSAYGRGVMEWEAGSFHAKVAIEVNPEGETMYFDGPAELEAMVRE